MKIALAIALILIILELALLIYFVSLISLAVCTAIEWFTDNFEVCNEDTEDNQPD